MRRVEAACDWMDDNIPLWIVDTVIWVLIVSFFVALTLALTSFVRWDLGWITWWHVRLFYVVWFLMLLISRQGRLKL